MITCLRLTTNPSHTFFLSFLFFSYGNWRSSYLSFCQGQRQIKVISGIWHGIGGRAQSILRTFVFSILIFLFHFAWIFLLFHFASAHQRVSIFFLFFFCIKVCHLWPFGVFLRHFRVFFFFLLWVDLLLCFGR